MSDLRKVYNSLNKSFNISKNTLKLNIGNSLPHELAKFFLGWEARKNGWDYIAEPIYTNGKRGDLLIINTGIDWEIRHSEKDEDSQAKLANYPVPIEFFESEKIIEFWLNKLGYFKHETSNKP